eukprot:15482128-Alexandrium_andersonii.AAC.1
MERGHRQVRSQCHRHDSGGLLACRCDGCRRDLRPVGHQRRLFLAGPIRRVQAAPLRLDSQGAPGGSAPGGRHRLLPP